MKFLFLLTNLSLLAFNSTAQNYNEPSQAIAKFLDGLATANVQKIAPFVSDVFVYQVFTTDKEKNVNTLLYRKDNFLYAVQQAPKDSCTEDVQMGFSSTDRVLSTVCSRFTRTLKNGQKVCGSRTFNLLWMQSGWQIIQGIETQYWDCPNFNHDAQNISLPSPFKQD